VTADPVEIAARVRAAEAYAGFEHSELAKESGIGVATIQRMGSPTNSRTADLDERQRIADACKVPRQFMEEGFAALESDDRLANVEDTQVCIIELLQVLIPHLTDVADLGGEARIPTLLAVLAQARERRISQHSTQPQTAA
jgi:hypothetical protein